MIRPGRLASGFQRHSANSRSPAGGLAISISLALEAEGEPLLRLAAPLEAPTIADDRARNVVGVPLRRLGDQARRPHVGLLPELPLGRLERILARIDAALGASGPLCPGDVLDEPLKRAPPDPYQPGAIDQADADAGRRAG